MTVFLLCVIAAVLLFGRDSVAALFELVLGFAAGFAITAFFYFAVLGGNI